jgi:outer membrane protein TolC
MRLKLALILVFFLRSFSAKASGVEVAFEDVWKTIAADSKSQQASKLEIKAATEARDRASLHWLPKVYLDARSYSTNDPGQSFFGLLSQRSVTSADFDPNRLNHPDNHIYTRGALGLDLPLFEGGMKAAQAEMSGHLLAGKSAELSQVKAAQFAEVAKVYGSVRGLEEQREKLEDQQTHLARLLGSYRLGSKSNPVGYSGLLGLKTLSNRVQGLLSENRAKERANRNALAELGFRPENWKPKNTSAIEFVDRYLAAPEGGVSPKLLGKKELASAAQGRALMEKARYLPKVGAFAEEFVFNGDRRLANGYMAGLYLQWSLFNPSDYGVAKEARLNAAAAEMQASASAEQERSEYAGLNEAISAIRENLKLLGESENLLSEQTRVATDLFKNGSINALQLVEALSRRTDLISAHLEAQLAFLNLSAERANKTHFKLPASMEEVSK